MNLAVTVYLLWLVGMGVYTAVVYARDKQAAQRGVRRVPERRLFLLNALGGFGGAWLAFLGLRHKTRHTSFWLVQSLATLLHLGLLYCVLMLSSSL
ncbi:MAG TPA: DUF1294 domain-containing protein [Roseiflexaceae bacterium]|nr:DUF1294 domain-containing protein [Roseiflexaceae bacterium]